MDMLFTDSTDLKCQSVRCDFRYPDADLIRNVLFLPLGQCCIIFCVSSPQHLIVPPRCNTINITGKTDVTFCEIADQSRFQVESIHLAAICLIKLFYLRIIFIARLSEISVFQVKCLVFCRNIHLVSDHCTGILCP